MGDYNFPFTTFYWFILNFSYLTNMASRSVIGFRLVNSTKKCQIYPCIGTHNKNLILSSAALQLRSAGHAKWQNIASTKKKKDNEKGTICNRYALMTLRAVREGGPDPVSNYTLAKVIEQANKNNIPKSTIDGIIAKSQKQMVDAKPHLLAYRNSLSNACLLIDAFTDKVARTRLSINAVLKKTGYMHVQDKTGITNMFKHTGVIITSNKIKDEEVSQDTAEEHAIEAGAEEVEMMDNSVKFICAAEDRFTVNKSLLEFGYEIEEIDTTYEPTFPITLDQEAIDKLVDITEKLEELEDINAVYANVH